MQSPLQLAHPSRQLRQGELYALQLRLHPQEAGQVAANAGPHIQAAFLDLVRQLDPALAKDLHTPNQRRPYTLGMLQGFNTLTVEQQIAALNHGETLTVSPGQVYWLRMTMLDDTVLDTFMRALLWKAQGLIFCIGETPFAVSRIVTRPETPGQGSAWVASSSFTALHHLARRARPITLSSIRPPCLVWVIEHGASTCTCFQNRPTSLRAWPCSGNSLLHSRCAWQQIS